MPDFNLTVLTGRLVRDPELRVTGSGKKVCEVSLAIRRHRAKENETDFFNVTAWEKGAEFLCGYFRKGSALTVVGELRSGSYNDRDGNKRKFVYILAKELFFAESKRESTGGGQSGPEEHLPAGYGGADDESFTEIMNSEDLPF